MRPDLLGAKTTLDWAEAQIAILNERVIRWRQTKPYDTITEIDADPAYEIIRAVVKSDLDPMINAEAGAILNMIRSSLDILAVTLAERNGYKGSEDTYFPIASSKDALFIGADGRRPAIEKLHRLSQADRSVIEQFKPYKGGNDALYALHHLDRIRKHQRMVEANVKIRAFHITRWGHHPEPHWIFEGGELKNGAPLCRIPTGADAKPSLTIEVCFNETPFAHGRPVTVALREFSNMASQILFAFDK